MAKSQIVNFGNEGVVDNSTIFISLIGSLIGNGTAESRRQIPISAAGTFSDMYTRVITNTASVTTTVSFRVSGAGSALAITYSSDETGVKEDTDTVTVATTDTVNYQVSVPSEAGTNTITFTVFGLSFTADSDTVTILGASSVANVTQASTTRFIPLSGETANQASETSVAVTLRGSYTMSNLFVNVTANARTTGTSFLTRKNSSAGNQSVTFAAAETGTKEDSTNTDSISSGDTFNFAFTTGAGTDNLTLHQVNVSCLSSSNQFPLIVQEGPGIAQAFNVTNNAALAGHLLNVTTTEDNSQVVPNFTFTAKNLTANVTANTILANDTTIALRDAGANGNQVLTYATAETGVKVDTDSDVLTADTDAANYQIVTPNTSGTFTMRYISVTGEVTSAAPTLPPMRLLMGVGR